jgi:hypothetical protein
LAWAKAAGLTKISKAAKSIFMSRKIRSFKQEIEEQIAVIFCTICAY